MGAGHHRWCKIVQIKDDLKQHTMETCAIAGMFGNIAHIWVVAKRI